MKLASGTSASTESGETSAPRLGNLWSALTVVIAAIAIASAFWIAETQAPPFTEPSANAHWYNWWLQPREVNAFRRSASFSGIRYGALTPSGRQGWAIVSGAILRTDDGGATWRSQFDASSIFLRAVAISADGRRGWAVGDKGVIIRTTNGGASWTTAESKTTTYLVSVSMAASGQRGCSVGSDATIVCTNDGGKTWVNKKSPVETGLYAPSFESIALSNDGLRGWVVGDRSALLRTNDGGESWVNQLGGGEWDSFSSIAVSADGRSGWVVGRASTVLLTDDQGRAQGSPNDIFRTDDEGKTWSQQFAFTGGAPEALAMSADGRQGWAVGYQGSIAHTRDSGRTWQVQKSKTGLDLDFIAVSADGALGWTSGKEGRSILRTSDSGTTWSRYAWCASQDINSITFSSDGLHGWAVGEEGTILSTADGGSTWLKEAGVTSAALYSVAVSADEKNMLAVGLAGTILRKSNGDRHWKLLSSEIQDSLNAVVLSDSGQQGWAAGGEGAFLRTADGGDTWNVQRIGSLDRAITSMVRNEDGLRGWASGSSGLLRTSDGGKTWGELPLPESLVFDIDAVAADSSNHQVWAIDFPHSILSTHNEGAAWSKVVIADTWLNALGFSKNGASGWAVGNQGAILHTNNDQAWISQRSGSFNDLLAVTANADGNRAWIAGKKGTLLFTRDGGETWSAAQYQRRPAPWFWVVAIAIGVIALAFILFFKGLVKADRIRSIIDTAISDNPIESERDDKLGFCDIANALTDFLRRRGTQPPLVLAINAPWGSGKSSLMNLLKAHLHKFGVRGVTFNAWHHQQETVILASLLNAIRDRALPSSFTWVGLRFRLRLLSKRIKQRPLFGSMCLLLSLYLLFAILFPISSYVAEVGDQALKSDLMVPGRCGRFPSIPDSVFNRVVNHLVLTPLCESKIESAPDIFDALVELNPKEVVKAILRVPGESPANGLAMLSWLAGLCGLYLLIAHFLRAFPESPSVLLAETSRKLKLADLDAQTSFRDRFRRHFRDVSEALQPYTLTLFIDDLDRCNAKTCFEMLEAVNYLASNGKVFIVLGVDRTVIEAQVALCVGDIAVAERQQSSIERGAELTDTDKLKIARDYARRYLQKMIQIEVPLPSMKMTDSVGEPVDKVLRQDEAPKSRLQRRLEEWRESFNDMRQQWRVEPYLYLSAVIEHCLVTVGRVLRILLRVVRLAPYLLGIVMLIFLLIQLPIWGDVLRSQAQEETKSIYDRLAREELESIERQVSIDKLRADLKRTKIFNVKFPYPSELQWLECNKGGDSANVCRLWASNQLDELAKLREALDKNREQKRGLLAIGRQARSGDVRKETQTLDRIEYEYITREQELKWFLYGVPPKEYAPVAEFSGGSADAGRTQKKRLPADTAAASGFRQDAGEGRLPMQDLLLEFTAAMLLVALLVFIAPARIVIEDSKEFEQAEEIWRRLLLKIPGKNTPREHTRLINRARYIAERLRLRLGESASFRDRLLFLKNQHSSLLVRENDIVALCAMYSVIRDDVSTRDMHNFISGIASAVATASPGAISIAQQALKGRVSDAILNKLQDSMKEYRNKFPHKTRIDAQAISKFLSYVEEARFDEEAEAA